SAPGASALHGVRESPNFCRPNLFVDLLRSIRNARLRYVSRERAVRGRDHAHRALGVVPPAVRIGVFFATVGQAADLVLQPGAVALLDDRRRYEDEEVTLLSLIEFLLEEIANNRDVTEDRHLGRALR